MNSSLLNDNTFISNEQVLHSLYNEQVLHSFIVYTMPWIVRSLYNAHMDSSSEENQFVSQFSTEIKGAVDERVTGVQHIDTAVHLCIIQHFYPILVAIVDAVKALNVNT
jgi:hypothetical protein